MLQEPVRVQLVEIVVEMERAVVRVLVVTVHNVGAVAQLAWKIVMEVAKGVATTTARDVRPVEAVIAAVQVVAVVTPVVQIVATTAVLAVVTVVPVVLGVRTDVMVARVVRAVMVAADVQIVVQAVQAVLRVLAVRVHVAEPVRAAVEPVLQTVPRDVLADAQQVVSRAAPAYVIPTVLAYAQIIAAGNALQPARLAVPRPVRQAVSVCPWPHNRRCHHDDKRTNKGFKNLYRCAV